jgi:hypothetical protein
MSDGVGGIGGGGIELSVFRETFLRTLDASDAAACREFGEVLGDRFLERVWTPEETAEAVPFTQAELAGVIADLEFLAAFLVRVGAERTLSDLTPVEERLSAFAAGFAIQVAELVARMREEVRRIAGGQEG